MAENLREIERDTFKQRAPEVVAVSLGLEGLASTRKALYLLAQRAGFDVRAHGAIGYDLPRWQKVVAEDNDTHYYGRLVSSVRVAGVREVDGYGLRAFAVTWITPAGATSSGAPEGRLQFRGWPPRRVSVTHLQAILRVMAAGVES